MGSPLALGPVLADIFMVELEISVITTLGRLLLKWKRYADDTFCNVKIGTANDTFCYVKICTANDILKKLNDFHQNAQFSSNTCELRKK